jgi:hypothetical protein
MTVWLIHLNMIARVWQEDVTTAFLSVEPM